MVDNREDITILIPAYRPDDNMICFLEALSREGFPILLVNDGTDSSYDAVFDSVKDYATIIGYDENRGKGYAIKYGISHLLKQDKVPAGFVTADSDGQHSVEDVCKVAQLLMKHDSIVLGERDLRNAPFRSKIGNDMSKVVYTVVTGKYLKDNQSGLRGFPMRYADRLLATYGIHYEYEMNVITNAAKRNRRIVETDIKTIYIENNKASNFKPVLDTIRIQSGLWLRGLPSAAAYAIYLLLLSVLVNAPSALDAKRIALFMGLIICVHAIGTFLAWRHGGAIDRWHTAGCMTGIFIKYFGITVIFTLMHVAYQTGIWGILISIIFLPVFSYLGGRLLHFLKIKLH